MSARICFAGWAEFEEGVCSVRGGRGAKSVEAHKTTRRRLPTWNLLRRPFVRYVHLRCSQYLSVSHLLQSVHMIAERTFTSSVTTLRLRRGGGGRERERERERVYKHALHFQTYDVCRSMRVGFPMFVDVH